MAIRVPDIGERRLLQAWLDYYGTNFILHLYTNNHTPADADTDLTYVEASYDGYAPQPLTLGSVDPFPVAGRAVLTWEENTFVGDNPGGPFEVYGYYVTDELDHLLWAERFLTSPQIVSTETPIINVSVMLTLRSEY